MRTMSNTIKTSRTNLKAALVKLGTPGNWDHITSQIGMFCYTGLSGKCQISFSRHKKEKENVRKRMIF